MTIVINAFMESRDLQLARMLLQPFMNLLGGLSDKGFEAIAHSFLPTRKYEENKEPLLNALYGSKY